MMTTLINALDRQLEWCKKENLKDFHKTYFDQAFGMAQMACFFYPNNRKHIEALWEEVYRPAFEKILYGLEGDEEE